MNGITDKPFDTINKVWKCVLCLPLPVKIKNKLANSLSGQDKLLNNLKEMENRIIQKIENKKIEVESIENMEKNIIEKIETSKVNEVNIGLPYKDAIMSKLEKKVNEINKSVKKFSNEDSPKKDITNLIRIVLKPNEINIRNSRDLRKQFGQYFPNVTVELAIITAGGSYKFHFETEEDANHVEENWNKDYFSGNAGIIKVGQQNRIGLVKFVFTDLDEDEIKN